MRIGTENVPQLIVLSLESDRLTDKDAVIDTKAEVLNKLHMSSISVSYTHLTLPTKVNV